jgi:hypothetical protein
MEMLTKEKASHRTNNPKPDIPSRAFKFATNTMRLDILAVLGVLAAPALADSVEIETICNGSNCNLNIGTWRSNTAHYFGLNCNSGCRSFSKIPAFSTACFDWYRTRGHFYFQGQGKRCLKEVSRKEYSCGAQWCRKQVWDEVPCSW